MQEKFVTEADLNIESDPYTIFMFAINSEVTKQKYTYRLMKFFEFIKINGENIQQRCRNVVMMERGNNGSSKWLLNNILRFLQTKREGREKRDYRSYSTKLCQGHKVVL